MAQGAEVLAVLNSIFENRRQERREDRAFELDTLKFRESQKIARQELDFKRQAQSLAIQEFAIKKAEAFSNQIKAIQKPIIAGRNTRLDSIFTSLILPELTNEDNAIIETSGTGDNASTTYSLENFNKLYVNKYGFTKEQSKELFGQLTGYHQNKTNSQLMVDYMNSMLRYKGELPPMFDEVLEMDMQIQLLDKEHSDIQLGDLKFNELAEYMNQQDIDELALLAKKKEEELLKEKQEREGSPILTTDDDETKQLLESYTQNLAIKLDTGPGSGNTGRYVLNMDNINFDKSNWGEVDKGMTFREKELIFETRMNEVNNAILQQRGGIKDIMDYRNNLENDAKLRGQIELDKFNKSAKAKAIDDALEKLKHNTQIAESEHAMLAQQEELYESQRRGENWDKFLDYKDRTEFYLGSITNLVGAGSALKYEGDMFGLPKYNPDTEVFRYDNEPDMRTAPGDLMWGLRKTGDFFRDWYGDITDYQEEKDK